MKVEHLGFQVTGMVGNIGADIVDKGEYVEVILTGVGASRSFDRAGLKQFIDDLEYVQQLANQVANVNDEYRGESEGD